MKNNHHTDIANLAIVRATKRVFKEFNIADVVDNHESCYAVNKSISIYTSIDEEEFCAVFKMLNSIEDRLADKIRRKSDD